MSHGILLASASPRRRRLLRLLGVDYEVGFVDVPEDIPDEPVEPRSFALKLAERKALAARELPGDAHLVLAADTIVVLEGTILGKPRDIAHAVEMLRALSRRTHVVVTAVTALPAGASKSATEVVESEVLMRELDESTIDSWAARGELLGCAGAYNIEGHLASVAPDQCYQSVAGLPLCHLYLLLESLDLEVPGLTPPRTACEHALDRTCELGRAMLP